MKCTPCNIVNERIRKLPIDKHFATTNIRREWQRCQCKYRIGLGAERFWAELTARHGSSMVVLVNGMHSCCFVLLMIIPFSNSVIYYVTKFYIQKRENLTVSHNVITRWCPKMLQLSSQNQTFFGRNNHKNSPSKSVRDCFSGDNQWGGGRILSVRCIATDSPWLAQRPK